MQEKSSRQCCVRTHCWFDRGVKKNSNKETIKRSLIYSKLYIFVRYRFCIEKDIQYIVAPFEADTELAYLSTSGHVDAVLTEDSDLLAYGCKKVPVK